MRAYVVLPLVLGLLTPGLVLADNSWQNATYGLSYIDNFSSCPGKCREHDLSYADDLINYLDSELDDIGLTKLFKLARGHAESTDIIEDYFNGDDYNYGDNVDLYAVATHGNVYINKCNQSVYGASYCTAHNSYYTSDVQDLGIDRSCLAVSNKMYFGEQINSWNNTYTTHAGKLRWLIFATCYSMNNPFVHWVGRFIYGLDYYMGYQDIILVGPTTDECLEDFAHDAFYGTTKFKTAWFDANDDWWADNIAGVFACGTCIEDTLSDSENWRDNYKKTWSRRQNHSSCSYYCSVSTHQG